MSGRILSVALHSKGDDVVSFCVLGWWGGDGGAHGSTKRGKWEGDESRAADDAFVGALAPTKAAESANTITLIVRGLNALSGKEMEPSLPSSGRTESANNCGIVRKRRAHNFPLLRTAVLGIGAQEADL